MKRQSFWSILFLNFFFLVLFHFVLFLGSFLVSPFILEFECFSFLSLPFSFLFLFDWVSFVFGAFVVFISSIIVLYSGYYMSGDVFLSRFILVLVLFVISMVFLIFGGNFFMIMIGWDGLGLVSFCLVVYYSDKDAMISGILTILMNRLGDGLILLSIFYYSFYTGFNFDLFLFSGLGGVLLLFSFLTSSAQFPFSAWLPAAMSAPTPISSLVHSSTLVTAGIYLGIRFSFIFSGVFACYFLMGFSMATMLLGGFLAVFEVDFSKIVAMSTLSQLGLLFFLISVGFISLSFFHMVSHAFFKSLLFMGTGSVIYDGSQDSRISGSGLLLSPIVYSVMVVSLFSLMAVPFSVGFYSSDLALDFLFSGGLSLGFYFCFLFGSLLTVIYSFRIVFYILPAFVGSGAVSVTSFSFFLVFSLIMGIFLTIFWGSFIMFYILMEDFVLLSYPFSMVGGVLVLLGSVVFVSSNLSSLFYSLFLWFKYVVSSILFFDFYFKSDQIWVETFTYYSIESLVFGFSSFLDFDNSMIWVSFMVVWFFLLFSVSLTT